MGDTTATLDIPFDINDILLSWKHNVHKYAPLSLMAIASVIDGHWCQQIKKSHYANAFLD